MCVREEGVNGQMPNLDLVTTVVRSTSVSGLIKLHDQDQIPRAFTSLKENLKRLFVDDRRIYDFIESLWNILWMAKQQASSVPTHAHAVLARFHSHLID
jgi:hypothetical protein